jgi:predicted alpha/beta hydrolase family esterase
MPRYISQHSLACLTRQGAQDLSNRIMGAKSVTARRVQVNMQEGKMLAEFDAPNREELEKWLTAEKFHFDWLLRLEYETTGGALQPIS